MDLHKEDNTYSDQSNSHIGENPRRRFEFFLDWHSWGIAAIIDLPDFTGFIQIGPVGLEITEDSSILYRYLDGE